MIEGLKLDVSAEELAQRLSGLIAWHESRARGCDGRRRRLGEIEEEVQNIDADLDALGWGWGYESLSEALERKRIYHLERASMLEFLRDHLVAGEVYRLDVEDLRLAGVVAHRVYRTQSAPRARIMQRIARPETLRATSAFAKAWRSAAS
jgi:hypothetical protein